MLSKLYYQRSISRNLLFRRVSSRQQQQQQQQQQCAATRRGLVTLIRFHPADTCHWNDADAFVGRRQRRLRLLSGHSYSFRTSPLIRQKTAAVSFSTDSAAFAESSSSDNSGSGSGSEQEQPQRLSVEEQYSRLTPLEHVLKRPGMYVGHNERLPAQECWVLDPTPSPPPLSLLDSIRHEFPLLPSQRYHRAFTQEQQQSPHTQSSPPFCMVKKPYALVPALIKVFDEILVNASDNRLRHPDTCTRIDVIIDPGSNSTPNPRPPFLLVYNDGQGIPVTEHAEEQLWLPELLFGHLLTGSNFDDSQRRLTGGRHGYGAKLTNIFSQEFTVQTADTERGLAYRQTWYNNMTQAGPPEIVALPNNNNKKKGSSSSAVVKDYTCISFVPDLARLTGNPQATVISPEDYAVMCRRVMDVAGCAGGDLKVSLNGVNVSLPSFADYCQLYRKDAARTATKTAVSSKSRATKQQKGADDDEQLVAPSASPKVCYQKLNPRWVVGVGLSETGSFESVSFVNGMITSRGGTHVNAIVNQVVKKVQDKLRKMDADLADLASPGLIRRHLFVACNALIENPGFDSQMKEYLTSSPNTFGSSCDLSESFLKKILSPESEGGSGILEEIVTVVKGRQQADLLKQVGGKKTRRQLLSIPKLEDAHQAGSAKGHECTLILTEGDSAKALAVAGLEVIGRARYGVFPLRGKFLNVRSATVAKLANNAEVKNLCSIMGLDFDKEYDTIEERNELRYGRIMLMTDQDTGTFHLSEVVVFCWDCCLTFVACAVFADGSHIKGLVINFFRHFWPKLLKPPVDKPLEDAKSDSTFLSYFITPLLKATKKGKKEIISFYSMAEFNAWRDNLAEGEMKSWTIKYYKGLGTSTPAEAKEYFAAFDNHHRPFQWNSDVDGQLLDMLFDKQRADERKDWILTAYDETANIEVDGESGNFVSYEDFVNKEMIHFSHADNIRSIPSVIDGLKPSQRKVLYACFKRKLKTEIKVAQLSGYCAEHTAYHHGEASLQSTSKWGTLLDCQFPNLFELKIDFLPLFSNWNGPGFRRVEQC